MENQAQDASVVHSTGQLSSIKYISQVGHCYLLNITDSSCQTHMKPKKNGTQGTTKASAFTKRLSKTLH